MNAIELLRVSTQEQSHDDRAGLPRQQEVNARTIKNHNLNIIKTITLIDVSGTSVLQTPEIKELISFIHREDIVGVVVADWDRLIRADDFRDLALFQHFKETNTKLFLPDGPVDVNTQSGFLTAGFQSIIGGNDLTQLKKRMLQAKEIKRKNGEHPNNHLCLPLGVDYNRKNKCFCYTDAALKVKYLFELFYYEGIHNFRELERLTTIPHRTIPNLLRNEIYKGYRVYTEKRGPVKYIKKNGRQGDRKKVKRSRDEIIRNRVINKPLIEESFFDDVQAILDNKRREYHSKRSAEGERFLYTGFARCGICGEKLYSTSGGRNHRKDYYYCRSKNYMYAKKNGGSTCSLPYLRKDVLEQSLTSFVGERLTERGLLSKMIKVASSHNEDGGVKSEIERIKKGLDKIHHKRSKLVDLYTEDILPKEELDEKISMLDREKLTLEMRHRGLVETLRVRSTISIEELTRTMVITLMEFPYWEPRQKRTFLRSQMPEFWVTKEGITHFTLSFSKDGIRKGRDSWQPRA